MERLEGRTFQSQKVLGAAEVKVEKGVYVQFESLHLNLTK